ncbi:MAG: ribosome biogenesis GTPase Der, partial [Deltaproteobacteria bacterium]
MKPIVAIVGRPNVGKSTLFNRLLGRRKAVVHDEPGVTRDLNFGDVEWAGRAFTIVDTAGFDLEPEGEISRQVIVQTRLAMEDADLIVVLLDGRAGPMPDDYELAAMLRASEKPVVYAVNKIDTATQAILLHDFHPLGASVLVPVSAESGRDIGEFLDEVVKRLPLREEATATDEGRIKVALVGRPNVGKSSILNRLIGRKRSVVSDVPGTTRDAVDEPFDLNNRNYLFIDTAGIRKKNRISRRVEAYCVMEAIKAIGRCDVAVLVIDANQGVTSQDERIAAIIADRGKCPVIAVNKWDIIEKDTMSSKRFEDGVREKLPFLPFAPVAFISALTGQRITKLFPVVDRVSDESRRKIPTADLNRALKEMSSRNAPPSYNGKEVRFYYTTQTGTAPQTFTVFTNHPQGVTSS